MCAGPAFAQLRAGAAPLKAPALIPTLAAPAAPSLAPTLNTPPPALPAAPSAPTAFTAAPPVNPALPAAAVPQAAARAAAPEAPAPAASARETLAAGAQALAMTPAGSRGQTLHAVFSGAAPKTANAAVPVPGGAARGPRRLAPATPVRPAAPAPVPAPAADADGTRLAAAAQGLPADGTPRTLDFTPTPASLKVMAGLDREVFLYRERGTGVWRLAGGDRWGVSGDFGDYDRGLHNHPDLRLGVHALYSPYPSPGDIVNAAGKAARVFVVSVAGVAEWNTITPFLDEPGRFLEADAADADRRRWLARLEGGSFLRRVVMRLSFPQGWPTLARALGLGLELRPWKKVTQEWLDAGAPPETAATLGRRLAPAFAEEALRTAERVAGRSLTAAEREDVVARTRLVAVGPWKTLFNEFGVMASYPDGVARDDLSIELTRRDPRRLPDAEAYYRALFAHEYTHRLQFEGDVTRRWGVEVPPVAVELLRGIELAGLDGLKAGRIPFITENVLQGFADGRAWARAGAAAPEDGFYRKGALAGAAWELAQTTGRPADAWEFVRRVSSERRREAPAAVYADIAGR